MKKEDQTDHINYYKELSGSLAARCVVVHVGYICIYMYFLRLYIEFKLILPNTYLGSFKQSDPYQAQSLWALICVQTVCKGHLCQEIQSII